jgi:hypothetical protein
MEPEVPVNVTFALPAWALLPAVSVTLCGVPGLRESVEGVAVIPAGSPLRTIFVVPANPFKAVADTCTGWPAAPMVRLKD